MSNLLPEPSGDRDLIVYLHGFDFTGHGYAMPKLTDYVNRNVPGASACTTWAPLFNSRDYTFLSVAHQLVHQSAALPRYRRRFAICHSMGGVIARQLNLLGANFDAIVTLNSPHEGTAGWTMALTWFVCEASKSLLPLSADLANLNARDGQFRGRYHFVGVWYHGLSPTVVPMPPHDNDNDTLIERVSQTGDHLGADIQRYRVKLEFGWTSARPAIGVGPGAEMGPHNTLVTYPDGDNPMARADTSPLASALRNAIRF